MHAISYGLKIKTVTTVVTFTLKCIHRDGIGSTADKNSSFFSIVLIC